jgi:hypothetical protein
MCTSYDEMCQILATHFTHEERYPKAAYNMLYELDRVGRITWATKVTNMLYMHGFGIVHLCQDVGNHGLNSGLVITTDRCGLMARAAVQN